MRIVINGWFWEQPGTGSGQYLAGLAGWLPAVAAGHEFILVRHASLPARPVSAGAHGEPPIRVVSARTPFDRVSRNLAKLWFEQVTFPLACRRWQAGVAFVPYWAPPWWCPCPIVVTIHDIIPLILPLYRGGLLPRAYTWLVAHTARRAHAILADSAASRRDIIAHLRVSPERVHTVPLGLNPTLRPVTDPAELARVQARYGLPAEPFLLYLGGFDARKNVLRLIEAFARLTQAMGPRVRLVIAGHLPQRDTPFAPDPRPLVHRLGLDELVHFIGWVEEEDKPALYTLARAALFISEYEGFGLPLLEAMACGCPTLAAKP